MSIPLTVNGAVFEYPVDFDENWGVDATGWAQAVTNGMLQMQGGSFPLTANVNFGPNFGLLSQYFQTRSASPATTGTVRLSSADAGIAWRNNANSANLVLTTDASDRLSYGGQLSSTGIYLRDTQLVPLTVDVTAPTTLSTTWAMRLPVDAGLTGQVLSTDGSGVTSWINAAGGGTVNSGTADQVAVYATTGTTISGSADLMYQASSQRLVINPVGSNTTPSFRLKSAGFPSSTEINFDTDGIFLQFIALDAASSGDFSFYDMTNAREIFRYTNPFAVPFFNINLPVDMQSHQIKALANASNTQDAVAFSQVQYGFQTAVQSSSLGSSSISSGSYTTFGMSVTITPTSASSRVKISVTGSIAVTGSIHVSIFRDSTNLAGSDKDFLFLGSTGYSSLGITYIDSPATTSAVTYTIYGKGTATIGGANILTTLIAEELR